MRSCATLVVTFKQRPFKMTSTEIKEIINRELEVEPNHSNVFGLDLTKSLVEPKKQKYKDANNPSEIYELWTVLEEVENGDGYKIYFDEETEMFGLGMKSESNELMDIGNYGSFLKTLYSM